MIESLCSRMIPSNKCSGPTDWLAIFDAFIGDDVADMRKYQIMLATDAFRIMERRIKNAQKR